MLWGCSSGHLMDQGEFDRTGVPWNYMVAGWFVRLPAARLIGPLLTPG